MPKIYSAREAAAFIGTDPRTLRRFLRDNDSYSNPGLGGRYVFFQADLGAMKRAFKKWNGDKPEVKPREHDPHLLDDDPGISPAELRAAQKDPAKLAALRERRRDARAARQQRLYTRMREVLPEPLMIEEE